LNNRAQETKELVSDHSNSTDEWGSKFYWKFEQLLDRIEHSHNYYQVLGINRSATSEQISQACKHMMALLHPFYLPTGFRIPSEIQVRIKQAEAKVALASSILMNFGKRVEYDNSLSHKATAPLSMVTAKRAATAPINFQPVAREKQSAIVEDIQILPIEDSEDSEAPKLHLKKLFIGTIHPKEKNGYERRRGVRTNLSIPVYVTGYDRSRKRWAETAKTIDISRFGLAIEMRRRISMGTILHLALAMPEKLRTHGHADHSYNIYGVVRRVQPPQDGSRIIAVELLGERPPAGYLEQPWAAFHARRWYGPDRRLEARKPHVEPIEIAYLDHDLQVIQTASAITEDVSRSGMRALVKTAPDEFDYVRVTNRAKSHSGVAAVRNRYLGGDGDERLCLNFLEIKWPI
jgi:hypothetical protein